MKWWIFKVKFEPINSLYLIFEHINLRDSFQFFHVRYYKVLINYSWFSCIHLSHGGTVLPLHNQAPWYLLHADVYFWPSNIHWEVFAPVLWHADVSWRGAANHVKRLRNDNSWNVEQWLHLWQVLGIIVQFFMV